MDKIERVAAYIRVSTQEQKMHGISLDAQRMKLIEYAKKHHMKIVGWYEDEGVSGRKLIKNRPELQRMINDAEKRLFERIIFIKLDRFFRSVAEYHECMKRISPITWTTTEEEYDLNTANGRLLVNMKLTIAELEADQTGERIKLVNEYKVKEGQALVGTWSLPFGFCTSRVNGHSIVIHDPEQEHATFDVIEHFLTHQSLRSTMLYMEEKHDVHLTPAMLKRLLTNTMLYGHYRGNDSYTEPYINKDTFDKLQDILKRNIKYSSEQKRDYLFSGLILCPVCGRPLSGVYTGNKINGKKYRYKKYRCTYCKTRNECTFNKFVNESAFEKMILKCVEDEFKNHVSQFEIRKKEVATNKPDIDKINAEIDRLNYSWQTGKIRTVEQYEEMYAKLSSKLAEASTETNKPAEQDFSHIEKALSTGWREIYDSLTDINKQAFWRSFIKSIEICWTSEKKMITGINFF